MPESAQRALYNNGRTRQKSANIEMYLKFRKELDNICVPEILEYVSTNLIFCGGKQVGIFCYLITPEHIYIDCLYIEPEYRRKGLAKKAVLDFYKKCAFQREIRLHIIDKNKVAYGFWNGIFDIESIEGSFVDTLYKIKSLK